MLSPTSGFKMFEYNSNRCSIAALLCVYCSINNFRAKPNKIYFTMAYYQQNMLSIKSRAILANILAEVVVLSDSIETFR